MKKKKQSLDDVKREVIKAIQMLRQNYPGANQEEAKRLLAEAGEAMKKGKNDEAVFLAQKTQLAANPTTEYLLSRANNVESQGTDNYKQQKYHLAISSWQESLKEYEKVCELANQRKEQEVVDQVITVMATIEADIKAATTEKQSHEMFDLISQANKEASDATSLANSRNFDEAVTKFSTALEKFKKALDIALENKFEDVSRLNETIVAMQSSIEACYLRKSKEMLNTALQKNGDEKEQSCSEVTSFLSSFSSASPKYNDLQRQAFEGIAQARIEKGMKIMAEAETLYKKPDYYQAKEGYRRAQDHFNQLIDFTIEHNLEDKRKEVDRLIDACQTNIRDAVAAMSSRKTVVKPEPPKRVADLEKGIQFETNFGIRKNDVERMTQLKEELKSEYDDIRWLTTGGGENYVAEAVDKSGNHVALRLPKKLDRNRQRTFVEESRNWENLHQRNIVQLIQTVISPPLLELEYVEGGSLRDFLKRNPNVDKKIACQITNDIARGLKYAHSKEVFHGDLKPSNILLTKTLEAKITDWSMGKSYTPGYAAPEQIGERAADSRTDVYSLGVIFYEMLRGENPYAHGLDAEKENKTLTWIPDKLSLYDPELKCMDEICAHSLAKNPNDRPTIQEFRDCIYSYLIEYHNLDLRSIPIQDTYAQIKISLEQALLSAKNNKMDDLQKTLESLIPKIAGNKQVQKSVSQMEQIKIDIKVFNTKIKDSVVYKSNVTIPEDVEKNMEIQDGMVEDISKLIRSVENGQL